MRASTSIMQDVLRDVEFPARKEQIIEQAKKQNAPDKVIKDLQNLPDRTYESADSLRNSFQERVGGITEGITGTTGSLLEANIDVDVLKNVQFPARKEQIMESLRGQNVSSDVMGELKRLPDKEYQSADAVMRELESTSQQSRR
jgi:hypothetical protein